ncbi:hypothetical protein [Methylotuvimicrobium buryatense]|uniref:hypothetical protein n=1 Tax=Methylotuvimicrobium buryatense TaxID=95641 RepID=UPI000348A1BB|nr:hypothetical protein [Methylotuvimicrobium buryatense]
MPAIAIKIKASAHFTRIDMVVILNFRLLQVLSGHDAIDFIEKPCQANIACGWCQ